MSPGSVCVVVIVRYYGNRYIHCGYIHPGGVPCQQAFLRRFRRHGDAPFPGPPAGGRMNRSMSAPQGRPVSERWRSMSRRNHFQVGRGVGEVRAIPRDDASSPFAPGEGCVERISHTRLEALDPADFRPYATAAWLDPARPPPRTAQLHPGRKCQGRDRFGRLALL